jgi:hypothetical protein
MEGGMSRAGVMILVCLAVCLAVSVPCYGDEKEPLRVKAVFWTTLTGRPALVEVDADGGLGIQWFIRDAQRHMTINMGKVTQYTQAIHENCLSIAHKNEQKVRVTTLWKTVTDGTISPMSPKGDDFEDVAFEDIEGIKGVDPDNIKIYCEIVKPTKSPASQPSKGK